MARSRPGPLPEDPPLEKHLRRCPSLAELDGDCVTALAERIRVVHYAPGERLLRLVDPPALLQFQLEGLAKMVAVTRNGVARILHVFRPGEVVGARFLLEHAEENRTEVVAMEPVTAAAIGRDALVSIGRGHPELLFGLTRELSDRLRKMSGRTLEAMADEVSVRLCHLLLDFSDPAGETGEPVPLHHVLTHRTMAQIVGASRPHTSSVLADLERAGAIRRRDPRGLLVRRTRLEEILRAGGIDAASERRR